MGQYTPDVKSRSRIHDKVVVMTGGANGIGAATLKLCHSLGNTVVFGDISEKAAAGLIQELSAADPSAVKRLKFVKTDVTKYEDVYNLFATAKKEFGRVDVAVNLAGLGEIGNWFDPNLTTETVNTKPTTIVMDVNLYGSLYFSRVATVFLRDGRKDGEDKSLILFSSLAGFRETAGLYVYQASKHGVTGLMRSLRIYPAVSNHIRVNAVCPWYTRTALASGMYDTWVNAGLAVNTSEEVAGFVVDIAADGELQGESIFIEGGRAWAIEKGIRETERLWLAPEQSAELARADLALGTGEDWTAPIASSTK